MLNKVFNIKPTIKTVLSFTSITAVLKLLKKIMHTDRRATIYD